jgi:AcrR family transcriptional regulator
MTGVLTQEFAMSDSSGSDSLLKRIKTTKNRARKRAPGRPTSSQSEKLRTVILDTALHAFMKQGFEAATIESIAREAKVAKITIYRQFSDKAGLFREVAHYAQTSIQQQLQSGIDQDGPVEQVIRQMITRLQEAMTHPDYLAVMRMVICEAPRFPDIAASMLSDTDYALAPVITYLQQQRDKGVLQVDNPREAAIQLTALAAGGVRYLIQAPSALPAAREHQVESIYQLFARSWGLSPVSTRGPAATTKRGAS